LECVCVEKGGGAVYDKFILSVCLIRAGQKQTGF
jgi:hypothetical protein